MTIRVHSQLKFFHLNAINSDIPLIPKMTVVAGTKFDRYEIISPLGAGGMGEVYLARDMRLERKVALKLLLDERTRDDQRLLRFVQEARAASALNHPNIITIYEISDYGSTHFIATEFIEGLTLRKILADGKVPVIAALDVAIQVASALSAAHEAGIIHRDIKPENVMLRRDGIVKVLDFGLAKLIETGVGSGEWGVGSGKSGAESGGSGVENTVLSPLPTPHSPFPASPLQTDPGTVMGTATYMAPEQARGWRVDARADIFSLGVVLYEMIAGRAPFDGPTPIDVMTQVLDRDPRPLTSFSYGAPVELQRIVSKAMRKDREERYQTVKDLLLDLRSLKRELEATTTMSYATNAETSSGSRIAMASSTTSASEPIVVRAISSAEYIVGEIKRHKRGFLLSVVALSLTVSAALIFFTNRDHPIESIAVLPFVTQNDDPQAGPATETLGDAITDSIINNLSQLPNLDVKPRVAVQRYKDREVDPREVASALDVHAVLTGRIIRRGDTLQVTIALVDAPDNRNLWGETYSRKISDLLLIQQEIASKVSENLRLKLSGQEKRLQEARQLYLKGRNAWNKRTPDSILEGVKLLEQAIQDDPSYAEAYAGLADCYNMLVNYSVLPPNEAFPKAKEAAEKALELDENLAEAHTARAFIYFMWEWNWAEAGREYRRAIELKPNYSSALQWYSSLLAATGRTGERPRSFLSFHRRAPWLDQLPLAQRRGHRPGGQTSAQTRPELLTGAALPRAGIRSARQIQRVRPGVSKSPFTLAREHAAQSRTRIRLRQIGQARGRIASARRIAAVAGAAARLSIPSRADPRRSGRKRPRDRIAQQGLRRARRAPGLAPRRSTLRSATPGPAIQRNNDTNGIGPFIRLVKYKLRQNFLDHSPMHVCQPHIAPVEAVGQLLVIESEQAQNGRV
jgi:eukaryotic-like serine/threonine-protein kinase